MTYVEDEIQMRNIALEFCKNLISNNEKRLEMDPSQMESLLEGDFITLDEYIFKQNS